VGPPRIRLFGYSPPFGPASRSKSAVPVLDDAAADGGGGGKKAFPLAGRVSDGNGAVMGGRTVRPVKGLAAEDVEGAVPGAGIEARDDDSSWCRSLKFSSCRRIVSSCILKRRRGLATGKERGSTKRLAIACPRGTCARGRTPWPAWRSTRSHASGLARVRVNVSDPSEPREKRRGNALMASYSSL
jgi:hypothetical protein